MLRAKDLKKLLDECSDDDYINLEYCGSDIEIERGDTFRNIDYQDVEFSYKTVTIVFS